MLLPQPAHLKLVRVVVMVFVRVDVLV